MRRLAPPRAGASARRRLVAVRARAGSTRARKGTGRGRWDDGAWMRPRRAGDDGRHACARALALEEMVSDVLCGAACYWLSDELAQRMEGATGGDGTATAAEGDDADDASRSMGFVRDDGRRKRYVSFGALDGGTSYLWYEWVDWVVGDDPMRSELATVGEKVLIDAAVYNPFWAALFIAYMGVASRKTVEEVKGDLDRDWLELFKSNVVFWVPMNFIVYGVFPLETRVYGLYTLNVLFVCTLSLFEERKASLRKSGETLSPMDVVARVREEASK